MALDYKVIEIFTSEEVHWHGKPLYEAIVEYIRGMKIAARCIVSRGIAGCYENGDVATTKILDLSFNMPLKIEIILPAGELDLVLPTIEEMVIDGIVVVEEMEIRSHKSYKRFLPRHVKIRDAMTPSPKAVKPDTPIKEIIRLLLSSPFKSVPVVDSGGHVLGIITQNDLMAKGNMPMRLGLMNKLNMESSLTNLPQKTARDVMTRPAIVVKEEQYLPEAVKLMLKYNLKRLPVVNEKNELTGMLSRVDIFRTITNHAPDWQSWKENKVAVNNLQYVRDIMQRDFQSVNPETSINKVIEAIYNNNVQRIAVVDKDNKFLGLIADYDLLPVISEHPLGIWDFFISKIPFMEAGRKFREISDKTKAKTAGELMKKDIITVREDAALEEAIKLMLDKGLKRLPVIDNEGKFKGMINRDAILRVVAHD